LLYIADCYEGQGRFASAYGVFSEARDQARAAGQGERERIARGRAALLEPKLHKLTIVVAAPETPGLTVKRGESGVRKEVWGLALPVDKGEWTITASAPGKKPWTGSVKIPEGPGTESVTIPALEDAPAAAAPPKPPEAAPKPPEAPLPKPEEPSGLGAQRIGGLVVGSAGLAGLVFASVFTGLAAANKNACGTATFCPNAADFKRWQRAGTFADTATGLYVGGGALAATGLIVFLTAPRAKAAEKSGFLVPVVGSGYAGLAAGGTFR
jgi:serine/threonine-protein kinase